MQGDATKITQVYWRPLDSLLNPTGKKVQALQGFDDEFVDIVDYIIRITHRIWEQKNIGLCYRYYADICPVHTLGNYSESVELVVQNTLKTVAAFPDRSLIGENVVWKESDDGSYYSSHLITSIMTNTGPSEFGAATYKTGRVTTIADCVCDKNQIVYEWLMRDNSFLIKQLGIDVIDAAIHFASHEPHEKFAPWYTSEYQRVLEIDHRANRNYQALVDLSDHDAINEFVGSWAQILFNQKQFAKLADFYHIAATQQWPGGRQSTGIAQISGTIVQWLAQCPDAKLSIDHTAICPFDDNSVDVAVRWSLAGTFAPQEPRLAALRGQPFFVLASSHLRLRDGKIVDEVTVFDEVALYANMIRESGATIAQSESQVTANSSDLAEVISSEGNSNE